MPDPMDGRSGLREFDGEVLFQELLHTDEQAPLAAESESHINFPSAFKKAVGRE